MKWRHHLRCTLNHHADRPYVGFLITDKILFNWRGNVEALGIVLCHHTPPKHTHPWRPDKHGCSTHLHMHEHIQTLMTRDVSSATGLRFSLEWEAECDTRMICHLPGVWRHIHSPPAQVCSPDYTCECQLPCVVWPAAFSPDPGSCCCLCKQILTGRSINLSLAPRPGPVAFGSLKTSIDISSGGSQGNLSTMMSPPLKTSGKIKLTLNM